MRKVLCLGNCVYDMTIMMDKYPEENIKYRVNQMVKCPGGCASNAAYLLGKWNIDTYFSGIIGNDLYGKLILDDFRHVNVKTKYVEIDDERETSISFVIANTGNGSRTLFTYRNEGLKLKPMHLEEDFDYLLVDGREYEASIAAIAQHPRAIKVMDASRVTKEDLELAKQVDYLVCSKNFAEEVTHEKIDINDKKKLILIYKMMEKLFNNNIVITLEEHGSMYRDGSKIRLMPSYQMKNVLDTTGAGDIYHGAFIYGLIKGYQYEDVIRIATIAGALSVRKVGGRYSIPSIEEVMLLYGQSK